MQPWLPFLLAFPMQSPQEAVEPSAGAAPVPQGGYVEGQVIVRFRDPTPIASAAQLVNGERFVVSEILEPRLDLFLVLIADSSSVPEAVAALSAHPAVLYAVPDVQVALRETIPNDPSFPSQWGLRNTGQSGGTPDADIDATDAWDLGTGSSQYVVAVVDGGGQHTHVDLLANRWENAAEVNGAAGVDDDGNGYVDDLYGWNAYNNNGAIPSDSHGTHVAGIVGARGNNATGVAGVNWDCRILWVAGASGSTSTVIKAYGYALKQRDLWMQTGGAKGANVVATNSSFGVDYANCNSPTYKPWNDMYDLMGASGILNAAATINANVNVDVVGDVPTGCVSPWMVGVTNTDRKDNKASAGYGKVMIDLGAPGTSIYSTLPTNGYGNLTGTSMASPHVAGAVAFLHSVASPAFRSYYAGSPAQAALALKDILVQNVDVIPSLNGITVGDGRLNLHRAALALQSWGCSGSVSTYCTAKLNSLGCRPQIAASGIPSAGGGAPFTISASSVLNSAPGVFFYGTAGAAAQPFQGGWLCAAAPLSRTTAQWSGGNAPPVVDCSGSYALDFNAWIGRGADPQLVGGAQVWGQFWSRDPQSPSGTGLSDAVVFTICP